MIQKNHDKEEYADDITEVKEVNPVEHDADVE
jgi:hypothetical protein